MGVNKVILVGNLGRDPELRYTSNQTAVCNFSIATTERRRDQDGNWNDQTEWHRIVTFGKTAENVAQYLKKGRQVYIEGRIQTRKWQDQNGQDRYTTEVLANTVQFLGGRQGDSAGGVEVENVAPSGPDEAILAAVKPADSIEGKEKEVSFDDDDIPF